MVRQWILIPSGVGSNPTTPATTQRIASAKKLYAFSMKIESVYAATWPSGKAKVCKTSIPGSNPGVASRKDCAGFRFFAVFCFSRRIQAPRGGSGAETAGLRAGTFGRKSHYKEFTNLPVEGKSGRFYDKIVGRVCMTIGTGMTRHYHRCS